MKNMFENAYFSKPYKTRDNKKAIFSNGCLPGEQATVHLLVPTIPPRLMRYAFDGTRRDTDDRSLDIVSEWQEEIDEEELDKRAEKFCDKEYENPTDINKSQNGLELGYSNLLNCYKAGYREAKSEQI